MAKTDLILKSILGSIGKHVKAIKRAQNRQAGALSIEDAQTLARYAGVLDSVVLEKEKAKIRAKKELEKLSTDQLLALYENTVKKKGPTP